jgi:hypothetical protein
MLHAELDAGQFKGYESKQEDAGAIEKLLLAWCSHQNSMP